MTLKKVIDTHTHAGHFSLAAVFKKQIGVAVLMHERAVSEVADACLDVRSVAEFGQEHIDGSINVPIDTIVARAGELGRSGKRYIVFCRAGNRSPMAADMLMQSGIPGVTVMQGGISLERQVRMIAGGLVLLGLILSLFVHRGFLAISVFVACGLLLAGITDSCLMGMLLMRLPYNRRMEKIASGGGTCSVGE